MIMLAKVVSYGGNSVRYALEKENAKTVKVNNMPDGLDPTAIWYMMKHHCQYHQAERTVGRKLERFMTTFVLSPSKEESANFTMEDWANLQDDALEVLDSVGLKPKGFTNEVNMNFSFLKNRAFSSAVFLDNTLLIFIKSVLAMARELRASTSSLVSLMRGRCFKPVSTT